MDERRQLPPNDKRKGKNNIRKIPNDYQRKNIVRKVDFIEKNQLFSTLLFLYTSIWYNIYEVTKNDSSSIHKQRK